MKCTAHVEIDQRRAQGLNQAINWFAEIEGDRTAWAMETEFRCST